MQRIMKSSIRDSEIVKRDSTQGKNEQSAAKLEKHITNFI